MVRYFTQDVLVFILKVYLDMAKTSTLEMFH